MTGTAAPAEVGGDAPAEDVGRIYTKPTPPRLYVVLRDEAWRRLCERRGLHNDAALGAELGVSPTTIWRIRTRQAAPGIGFVLQAMRVFGAKFEALFEVVVEPPVARSEAAA